MIVYGLLLLLVLVELMGEYLLYTSSKMNNNNYLYLGMVTYIIVAYIFYMILKRRKTLVISNILWQGSNIIIMGLFSYLILKEKLLTRQIIGIVVTFIGLLLVELPVDFLNLI